MNRTSRERTTKPERSTTLNSATVSLSSSIVSSLSLHFERVRIKVNGLVEPLTPEQLWRRPYPYGNSVGHLLLHLTGNLNYYIGARIANTGYIRDRPREFADETRRGKDEVLGGFNEAVSLVLATLSAQRDEDWRASFEGVGAEDVKDRLSMFVRCAAHLDHHAGQMIYLSKALTTTSLS